LDGGLSTGVHRLSCEVNDLVAGKYTVDRVWRYSNGEVASQVIDIIISTKKMRFFPRLH
jgi:hypothetical protein